MAKPCLFLSSKHEQGQSIDASPVDNQILQWRCLCLFSYSPIGGGSLHLMEDELGIDGWAGATLNIIIGKSGATEETVQKAQVAKQLMLEQSEADKTSAEEADKKKLLAAERKLANEKKKLEAEERRKTEGISVKEAETELRMLFQKETEIAALLDEVAEEITKSPAVALITYPIYSCCGLYHTLFPMLIPSGNGQCRTIVHQHKGNCCG